MYSKILQPPSLTQTVEAQTTLEGEFCDEGICMGDDESSTERTGSEGIGGSEASN
jgi:hypothetical protein